jgi:predicted GTPase
MSRWRILVVLALVLLPFLAYALLGSYYLWTVPGGQWGFRWGIWVWWLTFLFMMAGYVLAWYWTSRNQLLRPVDFTPPTHWTERDQAAWKLVEGKAKAAVKFDPTQFTEMETYWKTAKELAIELANFYHPGAKDPIGSVTVPEVLAVIELATHDMAELVDEYLPGGHLLTINNWMQAKKLSDWYPTANLVYWGISALFSPLDTAARFAASRFGTGGPWAQIQKNIQLWFFTAYIHRVGTYLIDLQSGRLRIGATRYRQLVKGEAAPAPAAVVVKDGAAAAEEVMRTVTITLMGQAKVGKSSLINAILGEQKAITDVLPATDEVQRYELHPKDIPSKLVLLDTVGYGHEGPKADQLKATMNAAEQSDLVFLVLHASNPGRQPDVEALKAFRQWFAERPHLKRPPVIAVLTHIDLLKPSLEWHPPYDWTQPKRPKEQSIQLALAAVREQFGDLVTAVVPVCTAAGKEYGLAEAVLPAVAGKLDEAHGVALLRCLHAEADAGKVRKVFHQLVSGGQEAARIAWQMLTK